MHAYIFHIHIIEIQANNDNFITCIIWVLSIFKENVMYIYCICLQKRTMNMHIRIMYVNYVRQWTNAWAVGPMSCRTNGLSDHREVTL